MKLQKITGYYRILNDSTGDNIIAQEITWYKKR